MISLPYYFSTNGTSSGLQLTNTGGRATLGTAGYTQTFSYLNGGFGAFSQCTYYWLNIVPGLSSAKELTWSLCEDTTTWSGGPDQNLIAKATSTYPETSTFLACQILGSTANFVLFLQTGIDTPVTTSDGQVVTACSKTQIYIESLFT